MTPRVAQLQRYWTTSLPTNEASGLMVPDRYGQPKIHPAVDSQKSAAATFLAAMKALALDGLGEPVAKGPASKYLA